MRRGLLGPNYSKFTASAPRPQSIVEFARLDRKDSGAEFAIDADEALVVDHLRLLLGPEPSDHPADIIVAAPAALAQRHGSEHARLLLVEQAPERVSSGRAESTSSSRRIVSPSARTWSHSGWSSLVCSRSRPSSPSGKCWRRIPPAAWPLSETASRTRLGICSDWAKKCSTASPRLPPSSGTMPW